MEESESTDTHAEIMDLLSNETRLGTLFALAEHQQRAPPSPGLSFTELRDRVEKRPSGNFNYHLDRLTGSIVKQEGEQYQLTYRGKYLAGILTAGVYTETEQRERPVGGTCPDCGREMTLTHADGLLEVRCPAGHYYPRMYLPQSQLEHRPDSDLPEVIAVLSQQAAERMQTGICPICKGPFDAGLTPGTASGQTLVLRGTCETCGIEAEVGLGSTFVRHPAVSGFLSERGVTPQTCPPWSEQFHEGEGLTVRIPDEQPPAARVGFRADGDCLWLALTEDGEVYSYGRA
jgi:DNA-binding transcriptional ArsR family regulator